MKALLSRIYAAIQVSKLRKWQDRAVEEQSELMVALTKQASKTAFGKDHGFDEIESHEDFVTRVPIRTYEELKPYVDRMVEGEADVLWPGRPAYFAKTSGTTSGAKYIPISKESVPTHVDAAKLALLCYINETGDSSWTNGKMIFLQGSPELSDTKGVPTGRLSGITAHWIPAYLQKNRVPSWETNCIEDWENKVEAIVDETLPQNMTLISGIPPWVQMYFERLIEKSGKANIAEIFPNLSLFVYGGVNYEPYRKSFEKLLGKSIPSVETYPASEGFIAFQDKQNAEGLLLNTRGGIFYEFIKTSEIHDDHPKRYTLGEVELGVNYVIILNSNAGLWGYNIGDTVKFVELAPYRLVVTGRIKHYTSAFGEHVIAEEVERSITEIQELFETRIREVHLAPQVNPSTGLPYHEWFIEFEEKPHNLDALRLRLDEIMQRQNPYYKDLIDGGILRTLQITPVRINGFNDMMKKRGKLGGQNKTPRLANNRDIADVLSDFKA